MAWDTPVSFSQGAIYRALFSSHNNVYEEVFDIVVNKCIPIDTQARHLKQQCSIATLERYRTRTQQPKLETLGPTLQIGTRDALHFKWRFLCTLHSICDIVSMGVNSEMTAKVQRMT